MRNETTAPLHMRALTVLLAFVLAFGLSPIGSAAAYGAAETQKTTSPTTNEATAKVTVAPVQTGASDNEAKADEKTASALVNATDSNSSDTEGASAPSIKNDATNPDETTGTSCLASTPSTYSCTVNGTTILSSAIATTSGGYTHTPWGKAAQTYDLQTITVPQDTVAVTFYFDQAVEVYAYDANDGYAGNAIKADDNTWTANIDVNNDKAIDYLFVQVPYSQDAQGAWIGGDLQYVVTFAGVDLGEIAESSTQSAFSAEKLATLENNLSARFAKGGTNSILAKNTYAAALALGSQGKVDSIDTAALLASMNADRALTAGSCAKYMLALNAAGINCTAVNDNGTLRNLVSELESLMSTSTQSIWDAVCILPALDFASEGTASQSKIDDMQEVILAAQNESGLFGSGTFYDSQTTAQAILALAPHTSSNTVASAVAAAQTALLNLQRPDGGFAYTLDGTSSNLDATANIVAALAVLGIDAGGLATSNGSTPLSYLVYMADANLAGYTGNSFYDEPMTSATVLEGLAAYQGYLARGGAYNVYDASGYAAPLADDQGGNAQNSQAATTSTSSTASPATSDMIPPLLLAGLVVLLVAAIVALVVVSHRKRLK